MSKLYRGLTYPSKKTKREIAKWITEGLRSGKFKQTRGELENEDGFCCLGVACKVLISHDKQYMHDGFLTGGFIDETSQPNAPEWLKQIDTYIHDKYRSVIFQPYVSSSLTSLNDDEKRDFNYIADFLELEFFTLRGENMEDYL